MKEIEQYLKKKGESLKKLKGPAKKVFKVAAALVILVAILELWTRLILAMVGMSHEEFKKKAESV